MLLTRFTRHFSNALPPLPHVVLQTFLAQRGLPEAEQHAALAAVVGGVHADVTKLVEDGKLSADDLVECATDLLSRQPRGEICGLAKTLFRVASDAGNHKGQYTWAALVRKEGIDLAGAVALFQALATYGHGQSQYNLGTMLQHGEGGPVDLLQALFWLCPFEKASDKGVLPSHVAAGLLYRDGASGIPADFTKAQLYFQRGVAAGDAQAHVQLARLHVLGGGGDDEAASNIKAFEHNLAAANAGVAVAQHNVATHFMSGRGCDPSMASAELYFKRAADQGFTFSQVNLAQMYHLGLLGAVDHAQALHYFGLAKDKNPHAKAMFTRLTAVDPTTPFVNGPAAPPASTAGATDGPVKAIPWHARLRHWWYDD